MKTFVNYQNCFFYKCFQLIRDKYTYCKSCSRFAHSWKSCRFSKCVWEMGVSVCLAGLIWHHSLLIHLFSVWYLPVNDLKIRICFNICKVYFYKISYQSSFCCCHFKDICLFLLRITYTSSTFCKWKVFVFFTLRCIFIFIICCFILTKIVHYTCI